MVSGPAMAPAGAAAAAAQEEMRWRQLDSGVSAVSFGFVATAILVSMFLAMAIVEHFLRPPPPPPPTPPAAAAAATSRRGLFFRRGDRGWDWGGGGNRADLEAARPAGKLVGGPSPEIPVYAKGVSVLMPGHDVPTFIAHPAPAPCPPERILWPSHQSNLFAGSSSTPS